MSTAQHLTQHPSRPYRALVAAAIVLAIAAVAIIAIAASGHAGSPQPSAPAAKPALHSSTGPSAGLSDLVRAHLRSDAATR
jgi:hypothetical protein